MRLYGGDAKVLLHTLEEALGAFKALRVAHYDSWWLQPRGEGTQCIDKGVDEILPVYNFGGHYEGWLGLILLLHVGKQIKCTLCISPCQRHGAARARRCWGISINIMLKVGQYFWQILDDQRKRQRGKRGKEREREKVMNR